MKKIILLMVFPGLLGTTLRAQSFDLKEIANATFSKAEIVSDTQYYEDRETNEMVPKISESMRVTRDVLLATTKLNAGSKAQITGFTVTNFMGEKEYISKSNAITPKMNEFFKSVFEKKESTNFQDFKAKNTDGEDISIEIPPEKQSLFESFYFKDIKAKNTDGADITIPNFQISELLTCDLASESPCFVLSQNRNRAKVLNSGQKL